jgi:four helix bundle protein
LVNERPHKQLLVWQKSVDGTVSLYKLTEFFPRQEECGRKSPMRGAVISVPATISEGLMRTSAKDKRRFVNIADASLSEIDTRVEMARVHCRCLIA